MANFLDLPERQIKPRTNGITILIDNGVSTNFFKDVVASHGHLIDFIKFGWCTAYVTKDIEEKVESAKQGNIKVFFGGTFFEKALYQNKLAEYTSFAKNLNMEYIEISNGTLDITNSEKAKHISSFSKQFNVFSEVGYKDVERSQELTPAEWVKFIREDLDAGAYKVITESRESGTSGICRSNGELRYGLIGEILGSGIDVNKLIFEAPKKALQLYFLSHVGFDVNLANIAFSDVIGLETLRLGLRGDTLLDFNPQKDAACA